MHDIVINNMYIILINENANQQQTKHQGSNVRKLIYTIECGNEAPSATHKLITSQHTLIHNPKQYVGINYKFLQ